MFGESPLFFDGTVNESQAIAWTGDSREPVNTKDVSIGLLGNNGKALEGNIMAARKSHLPASTRTMHRLSVSQPAHPSGKANSCH